MTKFFLVSLYTNCLYLPNSTTKLTVLLGLLKFVQDLLKFLAKSVYGKLRPRAVFSYLRALSDKIFSSQSLYKLSLVTELYYQTNSSTRFAEV